MPLWSKNKEKSGKPDELQPLHLVENGKESSPIKEKPDGLKRSESMTSETQKWDPRNLIHRYAFENNSEGITSILDRRPKEQWFLETNKSDSNDTRYCLYPLHYAALGHSAEAAKTLVEAGADINDIRTSMCFLRPLHMAALYGEWDTRTGKQESQDDLFDVFHRKAHMRIDHTNLSGATALHFACMRNNLGLCKKLIEAGAKVNACESDSLVTPLHLACEYNCPEIVQFLLSKGADVLFADSGGNTALHYAARCDNVEIVKLIAEKSAHSEIFLCQKNKRQCTALQLAIEHNRQAIVEYLLERQHKYGKFCGSSNFHLLHIAAKKGFTEIIRLLVKYGWGLEDRDKDGRTAIHIAAVNNRVEVVEELINLGANVEAGDDLGYTPLLGAASKDHVQVFKVLWKHSLITAVTFFGESVLLVAVKNDSMKILNFLFSSVPRGSEQWAKIEQMIMFPNLDLDTPLHVVAKTGHMETFDLLIRYYVDVNMRNFDLRTPLHLAVQNGHLELVQNLLDISTCSINIRDNQQNTPLFLAVQKNNVKMINILLDYGANILVENFFQQIPLDIAIQEGNMDVIEVLLDRQPKDDLKRQRRNVYPLHYAVRNKQLLVIRMLLEKSYYVDIDLVDEEGLTCLDLALKERYEEGVQALLDTPDWQKIMRRRPWHEEENSPMQLMIKYMPDTAAYVFDKCIYKLPLQQGEDEGKESHNYEFLDDIFVLPEEAARACGTTSPYLWERDQGGRLRPEAKQRCEQYETIIRTHPLSLMVNWKRFDLLSHDLVESYLNRKWNGFAKWFYYAACLLYLIFVLFLSRATISLPAPKEMDENVTHYAEAQCLLEGHQPYVLFWFIVVLIALLIMKFWRYMASRKFLLEKSLEVAVCIMALPLSAFCHFFSGYMQWTLLLIVNFIGWINLLNYIRKLPRFGVYVLMVWSTIATFLRIAPIFVLFLLPFSPGMIHLLRRVLHTVVFLTGEFDYESNIASNPFTLTYVMFFLYLLVGTVFLMNLLVGLAVSDTNEAMEKATKTRIGLEIDMILHVESCFPASMRRLMARGNRVIDRQKGYTPLHFLKEMTKWFGLTKNALRRQQTNKEPFSNPGFYDVSKRRKNSTEETQGKLDALNSQIQSLQDQIRIIQRATENISSLIMDKKDGK